MNGLKQVSMALATVGMLVSGVAQAALHDRGGGLLYDDILGVTWLKDANYAATQFAATGGAKGDADGRMNWSAANAWAGSLEISRVAGESLTGWRLPNTAPVGLDWNYDYSDDGITDVGYNVRSPHSELSYMYYVNLGLKGYYDTSGVPQSDWGIFGNGTYGIGAQKDVSPVKNLQAYVYWSGTAYAPSPADYAWDFHPDGYQYYFPQGYEFYAWAVRPGNVALVPEPEAYAMLLAGWGLLGIVARRRRQKLNT